MARMYSRVKGKSGSKKPIKKVVPSWVRYKSKELELLITKMAKEGMTPSLIGMHLRDAYGVPDVKIITGKSISKILDEKNVSMKIPEDLTAVIKNAIMLRKHFEENHKDMSAKRGLTITESKIRKLADYYKKKGRIPSDWKYDPEKIKLSIE